MLHLPSRRRAHLATTSVLAMALAGAAGCRQDKAPSAPGPQPVAGVTTADGRKLTAPALFAQIPADTPYVFASFEAMPPAYYEKMKQGFAPMFELAMAQARAQAGPAAPGDALFEALTRELEGKWNAKGLESLGLSATPRFAVYGLGLFPVFRVEIRDEKVLLATIERIARAAGIALPAPSTHRGRAYWRIPTPEFHILIALAERQLVLAMAPAAQLDATLDLIVGSEQPAASMRDGARLAQVMAKHGFGPYMVGFADTRRIVEVALAQPGAPTKRACTDEIAHLATRVPRIAFGYPELTTRRMTGDVVVELAGDLARELQGLKAAMPGYAAVMGARPLFAIGGGLNLERARNLGSALAAAMTRVGGACDAGDLVESGNKLAAAMTTPLPAALADDLGGMMVASSVTLAPGQTLPEAIDGAAFVTSPQATQLFELLVAQEPAFGQLGLVADGKLRAVPQLPVPFEIMAGISDQALAIGTGAFGTRAAQQALTGDRGAPVPLLAMTYDYGRFLELAARLTEDRADALEAELARIVGTLFGQASMTLDVRPGGLAMSVSIEMK